MSIQSISRRLKQIENREQPFKSRITIIHNQIVKPLPDRPFPCGEIYQVIGGGRFKSKDYQSNSELLEAVSQEHLRIYDSPYVPNET